ncbi:hypothetical protein KR009_009802, partial [Drosophila setifemur]
TDNEKFVLLPNKSVYTVGRLSTDLIIPEDLSVSRTHVQFHLPKEGDDTLQMEDLGSRYGTFIYPGNAKEPKKLPPRTLTPLPVGIRVRFGGNSSIWQVTQLKARTTASSLTRAEVQELEELLRPLGGTVNPTWSKDCSHLTMNKASVTVKLLHALLENKPIVTFDFWRKLLQVAKLVHVKEGWPQPQDYQPTDMDVKWRQERTRLFAGKTFVFMNRKHFEIYGAVVQKAGAACKDLKEGVRKTFLTRKDVIVIQYVPSTQSQATETINSIQETLEQAGLRIIQEYEIGMALINCSTKEFCNPSHVFTTDSITATESMTSSLAFNSSILVPNTERSVGQQSGPPISELIIPESDAYEMEENIPKPESQPQTSKSANIKRRHGRIIDSSDEEREETSKKRAKAVLKEKPKSHDKNPIMVDSSDEEEAVKPPGRAPSPAPKRELRKRGKPEAVKPPVSAPSPAPRKELSKRGKPVFVESSDEENNTNSKKFKEKASSAPVAIIGKRNKLEIPSVSRTSPSLKATNITIEQSEKKGAHPEANKVTSKHPEEPAANSKRPVFSLAQDDDDDDEALFQFRKSPEKPAEPQVQTKSAAITNPPTRISVMNFLEKSQPHEAASVNSQSQSETQPRKRLRLDVLSESDNDDCDDLFNFDVSKKKKKNQEQESNNDSNDGLFNFSSEKRSEAVNQDDVLTEPFCPEAETKPSSKYIVPQRKELPKKVDVSGWLSCSRLHDDIKSEANVSINEEANPEVDMEQSVKEDPDEEQDSKAHLKWLASMKDSIQVRMCSLNITNRSQDDVDAALDNSASKYNGRKNFKKFVKTSNPHPQRRVLPLKRVQLADGIMINV